jgi:hypothetical protein
MIEYGLKEVLVSIISAVVFGTVFSFFRLFLGLITFCTRININGTGYKKLEEKPWHKSAINKGDYTSSFGVFISVLVFGLFFMVLSYAFLDGQIRIYFLVACLAGYIIADKTLVRVLRPIIFSLVKGVLSCVIALLFKLRTLLTKSITAMKRQKMIPKKKN